jgi:hypothetical protein
VDLIGELVRMVMLELIDAEATDRIGLTAAIAIASP